MGNALSPASQLTELSDAEKAAIEQQSHANAALIHETIRAEGETELNRTASALSLSGLAAGLSMGFSLVTQGLLEARLPDAQWRPLLSSLGYTVGFLIVILGRQQLFTENTLTPILPLLHNRDRKTLNKVGRLWSIVLLANLAATWVIAFVLARAPIFNPIESHAFAELSLHALSGSFGATVLRAIFAGWLIALMVWILPAVGSARPFIIIIITYVVGIGHFSHLIAGSVDAFYAVETGRASFGDYATRFFLPTFIGNVIGGVALVAGLNYGQAAPQLDSTNEKKMPIDGP
ncbi:formate/nitrite transporter family protein [Methylocapsa palsarum]|uniref:formate/nitrite transporter family protein n=1 Tax=Methylocapsa palsarum TaxID=1612308 RepID=UPI000B836947|nr:formate/nitrite transporter family protein [Methylocapsa palsarum]